MQARRPRAQPLQKTWLKRTAAFKPAAWAEAWLALTSKLRGFELGARGRVSTSAGDTASQHPHILV